MLAPAPRRGYDIVSGSMVEGLAPLQTVLAVLLLAVLLPALLLAALPAAEPAAAMAKL